MWENLSKVIKLIQKTGDKCIILSGDESIAIMNLTDYEKLNFNQTAISQLSQEELLDKINREIAVWRVTHEEERADKTLPLDFPDKIDNNQLNQKNPLKDNLETASPQVNQENDEYLVEPIE